MLYNNNKNNEVNTVNKIISIKKKLIKKMD